MAVKYIGATYAIGESSPAFDIKFADSDQMVTFKTKVIDLPGPTRNGILYPIHEMKEAIERPRFKQQLATGSMYGEHDHPANPEDLRRWGSIDMDQTSFKWKSFWFEGNALYGEVQTVPINGNKLLQCIKAGELPNFSIRVLGEMAPSADGVHPELHNISLVTVDWVRYPGNPDSFVKDASSFTLMESPLVTGEYSYDRRLKASGESLLATHGLIAKGENVISQGNGLFVVAPSIKKEEYKNMVNLRLNAFK